MLDRRPDAKARWNACQNRLCGHRADQHSPRGRCHAYHCTCSGFVAITQEQYERGMR